MMAAEQAETFSDANPKRQFCTFRVAGRLFGVDILDVREIHPDVAITPVYHAPAVVKGYVNIRGQIHLILDLRLALGFEEGKADKESCLVIFKPGVAEPFGVLVDRIGDVVDASMEQMEENGHGGGRDMENIGDMIGYLCKLEKELLVVLNPREVLKAVTIVKKEEE